MKTWKENNKLNEGLLNKVISKSKAKGFKALGGYEALEREIEDYKNNPDKYKHNPLKGIVDELLVKSGFMDEDHNWIEYEDYMDYDDEYVDPSRRIVDTFYPFDDDDDFENVTEDDLRESRRPSRRVRESESTLGMSMKDNIEAYLRKNN